ncbi:TspO/MBR family protein [Spirosoma spitsbergense]|uniref:TspO/MBR family protein n=1 Tax=Spirosoma spitsbergense TaxID=431554 RepID=UPI000380B198|nr:tryptophan-rich sensory protein [Spirosoma spitsbergense]
MKTTELTQEINRSSAIQKTESEKWCILAFFSIGTLGIRSAFWVVWLILYPSMGLAAGHVWLKRKEADVRGPMIFYASILLTNFMFLPIANVSNGNPAIMTFMDINGVLTAILLGWIFSRYSKPAFYWLLPLLVWMPITAMFKILLWLANLY